MAEMESPATTDVAKARLGGTGALPAETALPAGTVTFLFTDIEGSTARWEQHPEAMRVALARHDALLQEGIATHGGVVLTERGEGDSFFALFARPSDALAAACALQHALAAEPWPEAVAPIRVRMALHTGEAGMRERRDYRGTAVNRCARLRAVAHGGQVLLSGATYELVRELLPPEVSLRDLGAHRLKDLTRPERVFQLLHPNLPADFLPLKSLDTQRHNLPVQPTALIGREREVATVRECLLEPETRLLTLTGPGGTGKTRLALQVSAEVLEAFPDGVFFVNLAPISDPALVLPTIAQTLGVTEAGSQPLRDTLHAFLHDKQLLLLLDNFEQVVEAASMLSELLAACALVRMLVTSRAALHLRAERLHAVPPLALPETTPLPPLAMLTQYQAVRLFIERAQDVKSDFAVTNETAPAVAEICVRLDGLPLAIELAAPRVRLFTPQALLTRLSHRLGVLTGGAQDLPARQRTLRATIDWSYSLLSEEEQRLFARLSVFAGGRTLDAIEAICNPDGMLDVLGGVESLLEKSLLGQTEIEGETRFTLLETLHEYARERLEASVEAEAMRRAHAAYFLALAKEAEPALKGPEQAAWLERLEREHDNVRAAQAWAQESRDAEIGLRLAGALGYFWYLQGHWSEGRRWLDALLALPAAPANESRARVAALNAAAQLAVFQTDLRRARVLAEESAVVARSTDNVPGLVDALLVLGQEAFGRFSLDEARDLATQSVALARSLSDGWRSAKALAWLGYLVFHDGDLARAAALLEESVLLSRERGDPDRLAGALTRFGEVLLWMGDLTQAVRHLREALSLVPGTPVGATTMAVLAFVLGVQGAHHEAEALLEQALAILRTLGAVSDRVYCRTNLASLALERGEDERAETLLGESLREARAAEAPYQVAFALWVQGDLLTYRGEYDRAGAAYQDSLQRLEPMRMPHRTASVLLPFGILAQRQGSLARARERLERALTVAQGARPLRASILTALARVAAAEGAVDEAQGLLLESLGLERSMRRPRPVAEALEALAVVTITQGQTRQAMRLGAAASGIRVAVGTPLSPYERAVFERTLDAARGALGADAFDASWASAQATPWEAIVDEALNGQ